MTILNTTFHIDPTIEKEMLDWIRNVYIRAAIASGLSAPMLTRIVTETTDGGAYALHLRADTTETARKWNDGPGAALRRILGARHGERALTFTTYLEILE